jgi:transketolase
VKESAQPQVALIGTGSELEICLDAADLLEAKGIRTRVVSMPCWEVFEAQSNEYRETVLPGGVLKISVEAAATLGWHKWVGDQGLAIGIDHFGASAPYKEIYEHFGLTADRVAREAAERLKTLG